MGALKMKDLCEQTGLPRQAIHFYIRERLLPPGRKVGRNMARYGPAHLERLRLIRQLQHEQFLPLKAIRAMLDQRGGAFSPDQQRRLDEVRRRLPARVVGGPRRPGALPKAQALRQARVDAKDAAELVKLGLLPRGPRVAWGDQWVLELWANVRSAGFTRARGFSPRILKLYLDAIDGLFKRETKVLGKMVRDLPADEVASMIDRVLPLIDTFLVRYHERQVRALFGEAA